MARSLGFALPAGIAKLLDGADLEGRQGLTFLLVTTDVDGWPHVAMLSVGEMLALDPHTLRVALWLASTTAHNLTRSERALVALVADGSGYNVRVRARRGADLDFGAEGRLASFVLRVDEVLEDVADYATLTSGVTFQLHRPDVVLPRWRRTLDALRIAP
jgi:hypothetical protein